VNEAGSAFGMPIGCSILLSGLAREEAENRMKDSEKKARARANVAKILADVPIDNRRERDQLHA
jgi:hypothetical protein